MNATRVVRHRQESNVKRLYCLWKRTDPLHVGLCDITTTLLQKTRTYWESFKKEHVHLTVYILQLVVVSC